MKTEADKGTEYIRPTAGKFQSSIAYRHGMGNATRIETFKEFDTPEEAYAVASAAMRAHEYADRIHVSRLERDEFNGSVYPTFVGEWDFDRETVAVIASLVDDDIADLPALEAAAAVVASVDAQFPVIAEFLSQPAPVVSKTTVKAYRVKGTTDEVTECDLCGKVELKGTVILAALDADGNEDGVCYFGTSCAAKAAGWTVRDVRAGIKVAKDEERERQLRKDEARHVAESAFLAGWYLEHHGTPNLQEAAKRAGMSTVRLSSKAICALRDAQDAAENVSVPA